MGPIYVPQLLDRPERYFLFYVSEILVFLFLTFGAYYVGLKGSGLIVAVIVFFIGRYARRKGWLKVIHSLIYWYLPANFTELVFKTKSLPPSYKRSFVG